MKYIVFLIVVCIFLPFSVFAQESLEIRTVVGRAKLDAEADAYLATGEDSRVGIGTTIPEFKLTLDNDGGIIAKGTLGSGDSLTTAGAGVRMIWYPRKAAFRVGGVGGVDDTQWDDGNIGNYSTAMGYKTIASGLESFATGHITTASGNYSTAMGGSTTASNMYATAFGGGGTTASGNYSTAMGRATYATGDDSTAMGALSAANGWCSVAMGYYVTADADQSVAIGRGFDSNNRLVNNTASSLMVGFSSNIPTLFVGPGAGVDTTGNVGIGTTIPGTPLEVIGQGDPFGVTNWTAALSVGNDINPPRIAMGSSAGTGALLEENSGSLRFITAARGTGTWGGQYRMVIDSNGRVGIGITGPQSHLHIHEPTANASGLQFTNRDTGSTLIDGLWVGINAAEQVDFINYEGTAIRIYPSFAALAGSPAIFIDSVGNVGIGTSAPGSTLTVAGTTWCTSGTWSGSDIRWKDRVKTLANPLQKVLRLKGVEFDWKYKGFKNNNFPKGRQIGIVAQELEKEFPQLVTTDGGGYKAIAYDRFTAVLLEAIKAQQQQIETLKEEVSILKQQ